MIKMRTCLRGSRQTVNDSRWNVHLYCFIGNNKSLSHGSEADLQVSFQAAINFSLLSVNISETQFIKSLNRNNLPSKRDMTLKSNSAELYCQQSSAGRREKKKYIYIYIFFCQVLDV